MTKTELGRLIDISAVRADSTLEEVNRVIENAKKYNFICVFTMPSMLPYVFEGLKSSDNIGIGGIVGFPSGGDTTESKVWQATDLVKRGCTEIDMVMNIGKLKSGLYDDVLKDIQCVRKAVDSLTLKVIIEVSLLTDEEIVKAAKIVLESGSDFVKTGTGWAGSTDMHHVKLIRQTVGDRIKLKVAGGVRSLETLQAMYDEGVSRFGIGYKSAIKIMEECTDNE